MSRQPHPFFRTWILTASVAVVAWWLLPGSPPDRTVFKTLAHQQTSSPPEISGKGSHSSPWTLRAEAQHAGQQIDWDLIALSDPVDNTFQDWPHAPIDLALIFSNLQRLGARHLSCAVLLAWEDPDPIGLTAMESTLADFDSVVIAAPLTRGAVMETLPPPFRRASLLIEDLSGDSSLLPRVNRVSIPNLIYSSDNTLAGFQVLDSEPQTKRMPLLARWDYRVVLAFPLVAVMQGVDIGVEDLQIEIGSHIQLGPGGPSIPIDEHGRLVAPMQEGADADTRAEQLIDAEEKSFKHPVLMDRRSSAEQAIRDYNLAVPAALQTLLHAQSHRDTKRFQRLGVGHEMPLLLLAALIFSSTVMAGRVLHSLICLLALVAVGFSTHLAMAAGLWLPALPAAATVLAAWICCLVWGKRRRRTTSMSRLERLRFGSQDAD